MNFFHFMQSEIIAPQTAPSTTTATFMLTSWHVGNIQIFRKHLQKQSSDSKGIFNFDFNSFSALNYQFNWLNSNWIFLIESELSLNPAKSLNCITRPRIWWNISDSTRLDQTKFNQHKRTFRRATVMLVSAFCWRCVWRWQYLDLPGPVE